MSKRRAIKKTKSKKKTSSPLLGRRFFLGLVLVGALTFSVSLIHRGLYYRSLKLQNEVVAEYRGYETAKKVVPRRIKIWNMMDLEVELAPYVEGYWVVAEDKATYLGPSAGIGGVGNMIVYGHNRREVFSDLLILKGGERLTISGSNGKEYEYEVEEVVEVGVEDVSWLQQTEEHVVTLYTCTGLLDSKRWVVRGRLVGEE